MSKYPSYKFKVKKEAESWGKDFKQALDDLAHGVITETQFNKRIKKLDKDIKGN